MYIVAMHRKCCHDFTRMRKIKTRRACINITWLPTVESEGCEKSPCLFLPGFPTSEFCYITQNQTTCCTALATILYTGFNGVNDHTVYRLLDCFRDHIQLRVQMVSTMKCGVTHSQAVRLYTSTYSHNEVMEYVPCWLLWLRGGGLVAAVLYVSSTVYFALGWRGHNYIVTCGLMV